MIGCAPGAAVFGRCSSVAKGSLCSRSTLHVGKVEPLSVACAVAAVRTSRHVVATAVLEQLACNVSASQHGFLDPRAESVAVAFVAAG